MPSVGFVEGSVPCGGGDVREAGCPAEVPVRQLSPEPDDGVTTPTMKDMVVTQGELDSLSKTMNVLPLGATAEAAAKDGYVLYPAEVAGDYVPVVQASGMANTAETAVNEEGLQYAAGMPVEQIWPPVQGMTPGAYPAEVVGLGELAAPPPLHCPFAVVPPQGHPPPAAVAVEPAKPPEETGGPAVFQGFNPPPLYAWARSAAAEGTAAAEAQPPAPQAAPQLVAEEPQPLVAEPPRPVRVGVPPEQVPVAATEEAGAGEAGPGDLMMHAALAVAMDELQRCQRCCSQLREEKRGVPAEEVEQWCASIAQQLQVAGERLTEKLEAFRRKSLAKDQTIKKLHAKLQAAERRAAAQQAAEPAQQPRSPAKGRGTASEEMLPGHTSPVHSYAAAAAAARGSPPSGDPVKGLGISIAVDGPQIQPRTPRAASTAGLDAAGRADHQEAAASPLPSTRSPVSPRGEESKALISARGPSRRGHAELHTAPSQKSLAAAGRAGVNTGGQVRREQQPAVHMRRREQDLAVQLRSKEAQVEHLTNTLRELQVVTQRQIGLYKRQLHLKDNSLQAMQEELMHQGLHTSAEPHAAPAPAAMQPAPMSPVPHATHAADGSVVIRAARRQGRADPGASAAAIAAAITGGGSVGREAGPAIHAAAAAAEKRGTRGGATPQPRPADYEPPPRGREPPLRGRHTASHQHTVTAAWPLPPKREPRDRSLGAVPRSPKAKHRDVVVNSSPPVAVQSGADGLAARRRTSPTAAGRSTSLEQRDVRRRHEHEAVMASAAAKAMRTRDSGGALTTRQRR